MMTPAVSMRAEALSLCVLGGEESGKCLCQEKSGKPKCFGRGEPGACSFSDRILRDSIVFFDGHCGIRYIDVAN